MCHEVIQTATREGTCVPDSVFMNKQCIFSRKISTHGCTKLETNIILTLHKSEAW